MVGVEELLAIGVLWVIAYIQHDPTTTVNGDVRTGIVGPKVEVELSELLQRARTALNAVAGTS